MRDQSQSQAVVDNCSLNPAQLQHGEELLGVRAGSAQQGAPGGRKVRVVEVGSGSGATSVVVMEALAHLSDRLEFVYTDLSPQLVAHGRRTYSARYRFASFQLLDVEKDTEEQVASSQCTSHTRCQHFGRDLSDAMALCELQLRSLQCSIDHLGSKQHA